MAEYVIKVDRVYIEEDVPGWMHREVHDHDRRYECDGHVMLLSCVLTYTCCLYCTVS